jgi:hypothetical protein
MYRNDQVTHLAAKIDASIREADIIVHRNAKTRFPAKRKRKAISKQVSALRRQLRINTEGETWPA